jgi:glycosyltransferase involved in cell wall biosynthesis
VLNPNQRVKIALVGDSLSKGGAEKVHAILSNYFFENGYDVHNCILIDAVTYEYSGSLLNLGKIKSNSSSLIRKIYRFQSWRNWVLTNDFDCLIDFRMRPSIVLEFLLSRLIYPKNTIYYVLSGKLDYYFPKNALFSKLIYKKRKIATVSEAIKNSIVAKNLSNKVQNLFQPFDIKAIEYLKEALISETNYILAVGNMDNDIKQIDKLILAYSASNLPKQNIKLIVLGEGNNKRDYLKLVENLNLSQKVVFKGIVQNPFPYYKNALFYVLSSKNEGLSNAIVESLACATPVVAFDCFSGPREIITNDHNGILVENQNFEKLTEAMNQMILDKELYQNLKKNSVGSIGKFSIDLIGKQWVEFIQS